MSLAGRTALITGSTSTGMGRSVALRLAKDGVNIILNYGTHLNYESHDGGSDASARAEIVANHVRRLGGQAIVVPGDTRKDKDNREMVETAEEAFGGVDILVLAAGGVWKPQKLEDVTPEHFRDVIEAEIDSMFHALKYVLPGMRARRWGRIITFSMNGAVTRRTCEDTAMDYIIGKNARTWMALAVGNDEYDNGITINAIEPGPVAHIKDIQDAVDPIEGRIEKWVKREKPDAHDGAEAVAFLCSEAGRFISQTLIRFPTDHW